MSESEPKFECQWAVYKVTEWRDGAVFKTEFVELRWIPMNQLPPDGLLYVVPTREPGKHAIGIRRIVKEKKQ